jgi:hypothetical protein
MPETSISSTRVYFLDGETTVKSLSPDGTVQSVMNISAPGNSQVIFAVSPDDSRIAIAVITLAQSQVPDSFHELMYVEDLGTAANRVDLYSSTTSGEWPVGWHAGKLIVGVASSDLFNLENPYGVIAYHVVEPASGLRLAALDCAQGLLVPAGSACSSGWCSTSSTCAPGTLGKESWNGVKTAFALLAGSDPRILAASVRSAELSPDGSHIAAYAVADPQTGAIETLLFADGSSSVLTTLGGPQGWLDDTHLVVSSAGAVSVFDIQSGTSTPMTGLDTIPRQGTSALTGVLPTNLS